MRIENKEKKKNFFIKVTKNIHTMSHLKSRSELRSYFN